MAGVRAYGELRTEDYTTNNAGDLLTLDAAGAGTDTVDKNLVDGQVQNVVTTPASGIIQAQHAGDYLIGFQCVIDPNVIGAGRFGYYAGAVQKRDLFGHLFGTPRMGGGAAIVNVAASEQGTIRTTQPNPNGGAAGDGWVRDSHFWMRKLHQRAYGELYLTTQINGESVTNAWTQASWFDTAGRAVNVTADAANDRLQIIQPGIYWIHIGATFYPPGTVTGTLELRLYRDPAGVGAPAAVDSVRCRQTPFAAYEYCVYGQGFVECTEDDYLYLYKFTDNAGGETTDIALANLIAIKID